MEEERARDIARSAKVKTRSVDKALELGVAESDLPEFFDIRWTARVVIEPYEDTRYTYDPSVQDVATAYNLSGRSFERLSLVVDRFSSHAQKFLAEYDEEELPEGVMDNEFFRGSMRDLFFTAIVEEFDADFEIEALKRSEENRTTIELEKTQLRAAYGIPKHISSETDMNRLRQKLLHFVFGPTLPDNYEMYGCTKIIEDDPKNAFNTIYRFGLDRLKTFVFLECCDRYEPLMEGFSGYNLRGQLATIIKVAHEVHGNDSILEASISAMDIWVTTSAENGFLEPFYISNKSEVMDVFTNFALQVFDASVIQMTMLKEIERYADGINMVASTPAAKAQRLRTTVLIKDALGRLYLSEQVLGEDFMNSLEQHTKAIVKKVRSAPHN